MGEAWWLAMCEVVGKVIGVVVGVVVGHRQGYD